MVSHWHTLFKNNIDVTPILNFLRQDIHHSTLNSKIYSTVLLKYDKKASIILMRCANQRYVIKHYHRRHIAHGFRKTRAMNSWESAKKLLNVGIMTATPIAVIEKSVGPFKVESFFVSEYIPGPRCHEYFSDATNGTEDKKILAQKIKQLFSTLAQNRIMHNDMKVTNMIIHNQTPYLIDLDATRTFRMFDKRNKDWKRFTKDCPKTTADAFS